VPTYDYQCLSCGTVTEVIHAMSESGPAACEHCGGKLRRVLYPAGIIFKGSGFYRTDSRTAPEGSSGSDGGKAAESSTGTDGGAKGADASAKPATSDGSTGTAEKSSTAEKP
jgi:putative FmdB family regulatory protein